MILIKVKESFGNVTIGMVIFSLNPFKIPWFSEVIWQCEPGYEKHYDIGSLMIIKKFSME